MKKLFLSTLLSLSFISMSFANDSLLENYKANGLKYFSKGHPKSFDLNVEIKYPNDWYVTEGESLDNIQNFTSPEDFSRCYFRIFDMPELHSYSFLEERTKDVNRIRKEVFSSYGGVSDLKVTPTKYRSFPGDLIEFNSKRTWEGLTLFFNHVVHWLFNEDKAIAFECETGAQTKHEMEQNKKKYYSLFRAMGNDIVIHNKDVEPDVSEYSMLDVMFFNEGLTYSSKGHPKSFDLNVEIKYPRDWVAEEATESEVVQRFVSEYGSVCSLFLVEMPESYSYTIWQKKTKDVNWVKMQALSLVDDVSNLRITPREYNGIPGDVITYDAKVSEGGQSFSTFNVSHLLFYKNKSIGLQCLAIDFTNSTKQTSQPDMNVIGPFFFAMGDNIVVHDKYTGSGAIVSNKKTKVKNNIGVNASFPITNLISSILFTWGLGLFLPIMIRFVFKERLSKAWAFLVVLMVWLFQIIIVAQTTEPNGHGHLALALVALVGYNMIVEKKNKGNKKS